MSRTILGIQPVREAIRVHGSELERVLLQRRGGPALEALMRYAQGQGIPIDFAESGELDRLASGGRHQGVIAIAPELSLCPLASIPRGPGSLTVVLDGIMDPQNFGAIVRSAVALGATAILWPEHSSAPLSPATFRASAGAIEHAMLCRVRSLPDALQDLAASGVSAIALDAQAEHEISALDLRGPVAIVIGSEDKGVRKPVRRACQYIAKLPMSGPIASLNASVAGAIAFYEVARQRASVKHEAS